MPERLECEVLQKVRYINTLTFTFYFLQPVAGVASRQHLRSDPPPDSSWSYSATDSAFMADGVSIMDSYILALV